MKRLSVISTIIIIVYTACNSGAGKTEASDSANPTQAIVNTGGTAIDSASNSSGANLIAANDCLTCHKIDEQSFGPSYKKIANRYLYNQGNVENLADKIVKGGKGLWGQNAMTAHPNVSYQQAEAMADYILQLRDSAQ